MTTSTRNTQLLVLFLLVFISTPLIVFADSGCDGDLCDDIEVFFKVFCKGDTTGDLRLGLSKDFNLEFRAHFDQKPSFGKADLFLADGLVLAGQKVSEAKVGRSKCTAVETGGFDCVTEFSPEKADKISKKIDTEQAVINVVYRAGNKDVCLGKFSNNAEKVVANGQLERVFCKFTPKEPNSALWGEGYFDPRGYGIDGESRFHLRLEGFPEHETFKGCVQRAKTFREVFAFRAWPGGSTDKEVYGEGLSESEVSRLSGEGSAYSYDLVHKLRGESDASTAGVPTAQLGSSGRSLSSINHSVSSNASNNSRTSSNTDRRSNSKSKNASRNKKKKKKRKEKRGASKLALLSLAAKSQSKKKKKNDPVFTWLAFDPLSETEIVIAPKCNGSTEQAALGTVTCGQLEDDDRKCVALTHGPADGKTKNDSFLGRACLEPRRYHTVLVLRAEGVPQGKYTVCVNGESTEHSLTVAESGGSTFGSLQLTDSSSAGEGDESMDGTSLTLGNAKTVTLSSTSNCTDKTLTGTLE